MPAVLEDLDLPTGLAPSQVTVEVQLMYGSEPLSEARDTGANKTIVGFRKLALDDAGAWTATLPGNNALSPGGTVWRRVAYSRDRTVVSTASHAAVPTSGGPHQWQTIRTDTPSDLPPPTSSIIIDSAGIETTSGPLAVNAFQMAAVAALVVTVPDVAYQTILEGQGPLVHSVANSSVAAILARAGVAIGSRLATSYGHMTALNTPDSPYVKYLVPPHSPGDYQLYVYSFTAGNVTVDAAPAQPGYLWLSAAAQAA